MTPLQVRCDLPMKNTSMTELAASRVLSESRETGGECIMSFKAAMRIFVNSGELVKTFICLGLQAAGPLRPGPRHADAETAGPGSKDRGRLPGAGIL